MNNKHFVYIVESRLGTYYTGYTIDLEKRIDAHNSGKGAKYLRGKGPVSVVYLEEYDSMGEALSREKQIKKLTREGKEKLVKDKRFFGKIDKV